MSTIQDNANKPIELTEIVELPKNQESAVSSTQLTFEATPTELSNRAFSSQDENLDVLFENEPLQSDEVLPYAKLSDALEFETEALEQDILNNATPPHHTEIDYEYALSQELSEDKPSMEAIVATEEEHTTKQAQEADTTGILNKLDNLDAMIDPMVTPAQEEPIQHEVLMQTKLALETLEERVLDLEQQEQKTSATLFTCTQNIQALQATEHNPFEDKMCSLENKILSITPRLEEMETHLNNLMTVAKRLNDLETTIQSALGTNTSTANIDRYETTLSALEQTVATVHNKVVDLEVLQEAMPLLDKRLQSVEEHTNAMIEYKATKEDVCSIQMHTTEISEKLSLLEGAIEKIVLAQQEFSLVKIQEALTPAIEKGATQAASRIIKEELQALLALE